MRRKLILLLVISMELFGGQSEHFKDEDEIMYSILVAEGTGGKKKVGYNYLISFNNPAEAKWAKENIGDYFIDNRTMDCMAMQTCIDITKKLFQKGIRNIDLGAHQICAASHHYPVADYFDFETSYQNARNYVNKLIGKYGYNWYAIACYHSKTAHLNLAYQRILIRIYFALKDGHDI